MILSSEKVRQAFYKVKLIKEHKDLYCIDPKRLPVSIEDIQYVIQDMYGLSIDKFNVYFDGDFVRGMVERYEDGKARVLIRNDQSDDWKRFITVKELCHLAIDEKDDWSPYGVKTIDGVIYENSLSGDNDKEAQTEVQSEFVAEIAAIEILYPYEYREADAAKLERAELTLRSLAAHYEIPEFTVAWALRPNYRELSKSLWETIEKS